MFKRRSYTAGYKLEVVKYAEDSGSNRAAAKFFNIDEKRVREWKKNKDLLEQLPKTHKRAYNFRLGPPKMMDFKDWLINNEMSIKMPLRRNESGPSRHHVNDNEKSGPTPGQSKSTNGVNGVESETILGGFENSATSGSESDTSDSDIEILDEFVNGPSTIYSHDQSLNEDPLISNGNEQENHTFYGNIEDNNVQNKNQVFDGDQVDGFCHQDQKMDIKIEEIMIDDDDFVKEIASTTTTSIISKIEDKVDIDANDNCNKIEDPENDNDQMANLNVKLEEPSCPSDISGTDNNAECNYKELLDVDLKDIARASSPTDGPQFQYKCETLDDSKTICDSNYDVLIEYRKKMSKLLPISIVTEHKEKTFKMERDIKKEKSATKEANLSKSSQVIFSQDSKTLEEIQVEIEGDPVSVDKPNIDKENVDQTIKKISQSGPSQEIFYPVTEKPEEENKVNSEDSKLKANLDEDNEGETVDQTQTITEVNLSIPNSGQEIFIPATEKVQKTEQKPEKEINIEIDPVESKPNPRPDDDLDEYDDLTSNNSVIFSGTLCQARLPRFSDINFNLTPTDNNGLYKYNKNLDLNLNPKTAIDINKMSMSTTKNYEPTEPSYKCNQNADFKPKPNPRHCNYSTSISIMKCEGCCRKFSNYNQFIWHKYDRKSKCKNPKLFNGFGPKYKKMVKKDLLVKIRKPEDSSRFKLTKSRNEVYFGRLYGYKRRCKKKVSQRNLPENTKIKLNAQESLSDFIRKKRKRIISAKITQSTMKGSNFNQFVCKVCKIVRFENQVFLNLHKELHEDPNFFSCLGKRIGCFFIGQNLDQLSDHSKGCKLAEYVQHKFKLECETPSKDLFHCLFASCQALGFSAKTRLCVSIHLKVFHNFKNDKLFICDLCELECGFPNRKLLTVHIQNNHLKESRLRYMCQIKNCSKSFITSRILTEHLANFHQLDSTSVNLFKSKGVKGKFYKRSYNKKKYELCYFCKNYFQERNHEEMCIIKKSRRIVQKHNIRLEFSGIKKSDYEIECLVQQRCDEDLRPLLMSNETCNEKFIRRAGQKLKTNGMEFDQEKINIHFEKWKKTKCEYDSKYYQKTKMKQQI